MKVRLSLFILCFVIGFQISAQEPITLKKLYSTPKYYDVLRPVMVDSTNLKGEKYQNKDLLASFISFPTVGAFTEELKPDLSNYFYVSKAQEGARFHLLSFRLSADKYTKTNVRITAPSMFEAYINGVKEITKSTIEDSLSSAKTIKLNFPTPPGTYDILIKYMSLASNKAPEGIKITVESESKDSTINYTFLGSDSKRLIGIRDILEGKRVVSAPISANGNYALLNYTTVKDDGKTFSEKELVNLKTNKRVNLAARSDYKWLPISNKLYYTSAESGVTNLYTLDPETLQDQLIATNIPTGGFAITPDEKSLIFMDKEAGEVKKGDLILLTVPESRQPNNDDRYFLSLYDLVSGVKQRLTYGNKTTSLEDISHDSRYILYSVREYVPTKRPFSFKSLYKLDLKTLSVDTLFSDQAFTGSAQFSPDDKSLLIEASADAFDGIGLDIKSDQIANSYNNLAFIMNLSTKKVEVITRDFAPSIDRSFWNESDGMIYFKVVDKDYERVYKYDPSKRTFKLLPLKEDVVRIISFADKGAMATYWGVGAANSTRAYALDLKNEQSTLIADPSQERLDKISLSKVEDWNFTASDGTTIEGRYYLPANFDATKKYPMIVYYYGGTVPTARTLESPYPAQVYAALGYVVYVVQPSGTIGYGQEFAARHVNGWGKRNAEDIIEGTKQFMKEHDFVNSEKVGCIGASYGGYMTMYLQTLTDIFAAAVSHAGISSIASYWGEGYWGYTYSSGASANSYPWNNKELYVEQSPLFNADKINTPLLLLHGMVDTNVPIGESIQMYTALKILGKPVEFIQVKGEDHGIRDFKRRIEWNHSIYAWFAKWLQDDPSWWNSIYSVKN